MLTVVDRLFELDCRKRLRQRLKRRKVAPKDPINKNKEGALSFFIAERDQTLRQRGSVRSDDRSEIGLGDRSHVRVLPIFVRNRREAFFFESAQGRPAQFR